MFFSKPYGPQTARLLTTALCPTNYAWSFETNLKNWTHNFTQPKQSEKELCPWRLKMYPSLTVEPDHADALPERVGRDAFVFAGVLAAEGPDLQGADHHVLLVRLLHIVVFPFKGKYTVFFADSLYMLKAWFCVFTDWRILTRWALQ